MAYTNPEIYIYDTNFVMKGLIDRPLSLRWRSKFFEVGEFELHVDMHDQYVPELQPGRIISVGTSGKQAGVIRARSIKKSEGAWVYSGYTLKGITSKRITYPTSGSATQRVSGPYEFMIKELVRKNCVNADNVNRNITGFTIATNKNRGATSAFESRYEKLHEEIKKLSMASNLGWDITLDLINSKYIFDVIQPTNRCAVQSVVPPIIFATNFENVADVDYTEDVNNYKNAVIGAGQGEGINRVTVEIDGGLDIDREEIFIDARDVETSTDLSARTLQKLAENTTIISFVGKVIDRYKSTYNVDYFLGDTVTVQDLDFGLTVHTQVTEMQEVWENGTYTAEPIFGNKIPDLLDEVKKVVKDLKGAIRK